MYQLLRLEVLYHGYYKVSRHAVSTLLAACKKRSTSCYAPTVYCRLTEAVGCSSSPAGHYKDHLNLLATSFTHFLPSLRENHVRRCHQALSQNSKRGLTKWPWRLHIASRIHAAWQDAAIAPAFKVQRA